MGTNRIDPKKQFSKKLALWTTWFWVLYMTWLSIILFIQPASSTHVVYLAIIATAVMMLNVASYTRNSITEKLVLAMIDKTKLEINLNKPKEEEETAEDTGQEGGDNG